MSRSLSVYFAVVALSVAACQGGTGGGSDGCVTNDECEPGQLCIDKDCLDLCGSAGQCEEAGHQCVDDVCMPCSDCGALPTVTSIDGTGTADGGDNAAHHVVGVLALNGTNLLGADVELTGPGFDHVLLDSCGTPTAQRVEVVLPTGITAPETYSLSVTNQAGSCDADVTFLQGEDGPPGSYVIGGGLLEVGDTLGVHFGNVPGTVAAGDDPRFHTAFTSAMAVNAMGTEDAFNPLNHTRFTPLEAREAFSLQGVDFRDWDNLVPDWRMENPGTWNDAPETVVMPLPGYPGIATQAYGGFAGHTGNVHQSIKMTDVHMCYEWGLSPIFDIDPTRAYEFSIWIASEDINLNNYFGFYAYTAADVVIGAPWANPYFKTTENDPIAWTKWTGYMLPHDVEDVNADGRLDIEIGQSNGRDWRWPPNAAKALVRFGACYGENLSPDGARSFFALPHVREVNL